MSEPQSSGALAVEMAGLDVIPESDRKGKPSDLFMPWFAANISVLGISWGSWVLGFGLSLAQAVVVSVVGVTLSFLVCGLIAIAGKRGSAPTLVLSRAAFGFNGNRISAAISWILTVGWETFLAIMAVQATATVMGALGFTNHVVAQIIALILVVVLAAGSGILGFEAIMKVQTWITWATAALTIIYLVLVAPTIDFAVLSSRPSAPLTAVLGAGCMLLVGFGFGWINAAADYSRYLPRAASTKGVVGWTTVGAALPTVILVFFGILLVGSADESLSEAIGGDPIGALTTLLPTWFLIPFALVAILGLIGIIRVHQFNKAEMFVYCPVEQAEEMHEKLLALEEEMLQRCGLAYRVIDTAAGDLGTSAARKFDCEAWVPTQGTYRELTSTSNCTTYQARRLNIRERTPDTVDEAGNVRKGRTRSVATLNGTLATTRWLVAILETHQQADGSVVIPEALRPYMGGAEVIPAVAAE